MTAPGYVPASLVEVRCWGTPVGVVAQNPATGYYALEYYPEWLGSGVELAPLHTPLGPGAFEYPALPEGTFHRLPAFLADSLPDAFGNALVNAWMAERGIGEPQITPLDRLAYAAGRSIGALTFHPPATPEVGPTSAVQLADLVVAARSVIRGDFGDGATVREALHQLIQVGTSAGGARAKAVVAWNPETNQVRTGQLAAPEGYEHWLIKLDGVGGLQTGPALDGAPEPSGAGAAYGRIEYAYHLMARQAGLEMTDCHLMVEGPRAHFMTRRFDRGAGTTRHHLLTLCAMAHLDFRQLGAHSYAQYLQTVQQLGLGRDALAQAYRRMVFNVVGLNRDDHTKNVAFLLRPNGRWELAPAYDITHAHNPRGEWTQRHQMSVNGRFDGITVADLHAVGEQFDVPGYRKVVREVLDVVAGWEGFAARAGLPEEQVARIREDLDEHRPR